MKKLAYGLLMAGLCSNSFALDTQPVHSIPAAPITPAMWQMKVPSNTIAQVVTTCKQNTLENQYGCALTAQVLDGLKLKKEGKDIHLSGDYNVYWWPVKAFSDDHFHLALIPIKLVQ